MAKITLYGCERWFNLRNQSLFDSIVLPTGCNKDTFVENLMLKAGEFALLYANCDFMKEAVTSWSYKNQIAFDRIWKTWNEEYDALHNYDRHEESNDSVTETHKLNRDETEGVLNETETNSGVVSSSKSNTSVAAFDSSSLEPREGQDGTVNETSGVTGKSEGTTTRNTEDLSSDQRAASHQIRAYGNIGVTSSQQLLEAEMQARLKFNPYDLMVNDFIMEFTIPVYD